MIINGKKIAGRILKQVAQKTHDLTRAGKTPKLAVVLVGNDPASRTYVRKKGQAAKKVGIDFELHHYEAHISFNRLQEEIISIQEKTGLSGLVIQLPVPEDFYPGILHAVEPKFDVDCLTYYNLGQLVMKTNRMIPPTPGAVMSVLEDIGADLKGKTVVIVGAGVLVGKPLSIIMMNQEATVISCNAFTPHMADLTKKADVLISGVGKKHIITADMVKEGAIVIDAGVDFQNNQMFGDVDFDAVEPIASHITPTPGGIGPITVARLLLNTAISAESFV